MMGRFVRPIGLGPADSPAAVELSATLLMLARPGCAALRGSTWRYTMLANVAALLLMPPPSSQVCEYVWGERARKGTLLDHMCVAKRLCSSLIPHNTPHKHMPTPVCRPSMITSSPPAFQVALPFVRHFLELLSSCEVLGLRQLALGGITFQVLGFRGRGVGFRGGV